MIRLSAWTEECRGQKLNLYKCGNHINIYIKAVREMKCQLKSGPIMFEILSGSMTSAGFDIQFLQSKCMKCFYLIHPASV